MNAPLHSESRRMVLASAGAVAFASALPLYAEGMPKANQTPSKVLRTGNGEWTYDAVSGWGALPTGTTFGGTHGAIAQDNTGNIYVSTQSTTGILVYPSDGRLLKTIAQIFRKSTRWSPRRRRAQSTSLRRSRKGLARTGGSSREFGA